MSSTCPPGRLGPRIFKHVCDLSVRRISQVFRGVTEAKQIPGGDQDVQILNVTASLAIICAFLCVIAGYGVGTRRIDVMTQVVGMYS